MTSQYQDFDPYDDTVYGTLLTPHHKHIHHYHHRHHHHTMNPSSTINPTPVLFTSPTSYLASSLLSDETSILSQTLHDPYSLEIIDLGSVDAMGNTTAHALRHQEHTDQLRQFLAAPASQTRTATIQRAFDIFCHLDQDHRGVIDVNQLHHALSMFGTASQFTMEEVKHIFRIASQNGEEFLRFADFYSIFACLTLLKGRFGTESTFLTQSQIKSALLEAGLDVNTKHLQHMFAVKASGAEITDEEATKDFNAEQVDFAQLLEIYISAPRSEDDLFLFSWYKVGQSNFLLHKQHVEASPAQDFIAGTAAGVALTLVGHPFDTIKVRMQTGGFSSPLAAIRQTLAREGPLAVYKGMGGPMLTIPIINAIVFTCYSHAQSLFRRFNDDPHAELALWQIALAGMYAGFLNCAIACPVELVKTRLQIQYGERGSFRGPVDCIQHILKASGPKGLFRGMTSTIYRELPGYGAQFYFYEWSKRFCMKSGNRSEFELTPFELLMSGGCAGLAGWVFSYPMDYIKSQIQAEPWNKKSRYKKHPFLFDGGFFSCVQATTKRHGWKELWRGFSVCAARGFPANAAGFLAYETTLAFMRQNNIFSSPKSPKSSQ